MLVPQSARFGQNLDLSAPLIEKQTGSNPTYSDIASWKTEYFNK